MATILRQAFHLIGRDQRRRWLALTFLALVASGFEILGALLVYLLLALVADPGGAVALPLVGDVRAVAGDLDEDTLLLGLVVALAVFFALRAVVKIGVTYAQYRVAHNAGARLSNRLVQGYLSWPYALHLRRNSSELIRNGHVAVKQLVAQVFIPVIRVSAETVLIVGMLAVLAVIAPAPTALAILVIGSAAGLLLLVVQPRLKRIGEVSHQSTQEAFGSLQQSLHGLRDIKMLGREGYFAQQYARSRFRLARALYLHATAVELPRTITDAALIGFILLFFGITILTGSPAQEVLSIIGLFAYVGMRLQPSLQRIISGVNDLKYSTAPLGDLSADLQAIEALPPSVEQVAPLPFLRELTLDDVSFRYEGAEQPALSGIRLTIRPGEEIGICGPTGGGKTTLVDILTGLLEPTSGRVLVDGADLRDRTRAWQRNLGVVPQTVFLTDDTLRRNIALGVPDADIDEGAVAEAVELAQLSEFIGSLPEGLDTTVGERGVRISGGQRQRIAIARALYRRPAVLVFDEGTSALDNATEAQLMAAIERLRGRHTIILIAHRLSTVRDSDRVLFVERGQITGHGSYDELVRTHPSFRSMAGAP